MRNSRLLTILLELMRGETVSAMDMAEKMEVSLRTIYRDMDALSAAGIPIVSQSGQHGGYRIMEGYLLRNLSMSPEERSFLMSILFDMSKSSKEAASLHKKLSALHLGTHKNTEWLRIDMPGLNTNFETCKQAILGHRLLTFSYRGVRKCTRRTVEPVSLLYRGGYFYLFAYCLKRKDYRLFRLNRLHGASIEEQGFEEHTMDIYAWESSTQRFPQDHILLRCVASRQQRLLDDFPHDALSRQEDSILVKLDWWIDEWVISLILSYGEDMQVLHPSWLKEEIAMRAARASIKHFATFKEEKIMDQTMVFCQSCAMPLQNDADKGSESDGSKSEKYCKHCYGEGKFLHEQTMEEMIESCIPFVSNGNPYPNEEAARAAMQEYFPQLERWKK